MAQHVYARLSGLGWTLVPLAPFLIERPAGRPWPLVATHEGPGEVKRAILSFPANNLPDFEFAEGTTSLGDVLDISQGPDLDHWRVETSVFTCRWPDGFALASAPSPGPPFDLHGPGGSLVFVQGPFGLTRLPPIDRMVGPEQTVFRSGSSPRGGWVELGYEHGGVPWRQTHRVVEDGRGFALVVTSQAPEQWARPVEQAAEVVAASLAPYASG
jgi:hypothetical protein